MNPRLANACIRILSILLTAAAFYVYANSGFEPSNKDLGIMLVFIGAAIQGNFAADRIARKHNLS